MWTHIKKVRITGPLWGNSLVTPAQRASNVEKASIFIGHHDTDNGGVVTKNRNNRRAGCVNMREADKCGYFVVANCWEINDIEYSTTAREEIEREHYRWYTSIQLYIVYLGNICWSEVILAHCGYFEEHCHTYTSYLETMVLQPFQSTYEYCIAQGKRQNHNIKTVWDIPVSCQGRVILTFMPGLKLMPWWLWLSWLFKILSISFKNWYSISIHNQNMCTISVLMF